MYNLLGPKRKSELQKRLFSRLLLGLSISDVFSSTTLFIGSWAIPKDTLHDDFLHGIQRGTQTTCNIQGFFIQVFYFSSIFYIGSIAINFLCCVSWNMSEAEIAKYRIEYYLHGVSLAVPLLLAVLGLLYDMYNPVTYFCYISTYPIACDHQSQIDCIRGSNIWFWRSIVQIIPFSLSFLTVCYCMVSIYRTVKKQEQTISRYSNRFGRINQLKESRLAYRKALEYIGIFFCCQGPVVLSGLIFDLGVQVSYPFWFMNAFFVPCQGFFNALVYSGILKKKIHDTVQVSKDFVSSRMIMLGRSSDDRSGDGDISWILDDNQNTASKQEQKRRSSKEERKASEGSTEDHCLTSKPGVMSIAEDKEGTASLEAEETEPNLATTSAKTTRTHTTSPSLSTPPQPMTDYF